MEGGGNNRVCVWGGGGGGVTMEASMSNSKGSFVMGSMLTGGVWGWIVVE